MANFVSVPSQVLEDFLQKKGFTATTQRNEIVYIKRSKVDPNLMLKVYTSIAVGSTAVRAAGKDALRCCVVWDNGLGRSFGVGKFNPVFRVHSVQSVLERLELRLKEAAQRARDWLGEQAAREDLRQKNLFAEQERQAEQRAFMADMQRQTPPQEEPSSEPPQSGPTFEEYANTLEVPF